LAEQAGRLDVDALLDTVTPQEFDEWVAYKKLEPDKLDRLRTIITTGLLALCNSWDCKMKPKDLDPILKDEEQAEEVTPEEAIRRMKEVY